MVCNYNHPEVNTRGKLVALYEIEGLERVPCESAMAGDIVCFAGLEKINIGDTLCASSCVEAVPFVENPTLEEVLAADALARKTVRRCRA